ncbi:MAG: hypothetical protein AB7I37_05365 [Pirellulales bacterium]
MSLWLLFGAMYLEWLQARWPGNRSSTDGSKWRVISLTALRRLAERDYRLAHGVDPEGELSPSQQAELQDEIQEKIEIRNAESAFRGAVGTVGLFQYLLIPVTIGLLILAIRQFKTASKHHLSASIDLSVVCISFSMICVAISLGLLAYRNYWGMLAW